MNRLCSCGSRVDSGYSRVCDRCSGTRYLTRYYLSGALIAGQEVAKARRRGLLPAPSTLQCADCGISATEYDHRDYNYPLLVAPVCHGCNVRRGKAIPKRWHESEWPEYVTRIKAARCFRRAPVLRFIDELKPEMRKAA